MIHPFRAIDRVRRHVLGDLHYGLETGHGKDWVAIILATATSTAMIFLVLGGFSIQIVEHVDTSDNTVQLLSGLIAGLTAILGSYVGYRAAPEPDSKPKDMPVDEFGKPIYPTDSRLLMPPGAE